MYYCTKCGAQIEDNATFCSGCGHKVGGVGYKEPPAKSTSQSTGLSSIARIFMIIGTVIVAIETLGIALAWCLPMLNSYTEKIKRREPISVGFKVCTLLFVSAVAGVLMLCDQEH